MSRANSPDSLPKRPSFEELVEAGETGLRQLLDEVAIRAHMKYRPLDASALEAFLNDPECVRYPTRLAFEFGEMAPHQFAEPNADLRDPDRQGRVLYVRPFLHSRPELLPAAVVYMIPVINFGEAVTDAHCLQYGSTVLGLTQDEYYRQVCALADLAGAETRFPNAPQP